MYKLSTSILQNRLFSSNNILKYYYSTSIPKGFKTGTYACGLKKSGASDICVIFSEKECNASAVFTENKVRAAPVLLSKSLLEQFNCSGFQSMVINSGGANACTGEQGMKNAETMSNLSAKLLKSKQPSVVMSTGIIGQQLDMKKVEKGIEEAVKSLGNDWTLAAKAIMTTDKVHKLYQKSVKLSDGKEVNISGICKGAGMIHPNMATMLCIICTDADVAKEPLKQALKHSVHYSFNSINVDGDMSTNDTVCVYANGMAGNKQISSTSSEDFNRFQSALRETAEELSKMIVRDAEGATKFVSVVVRGANSESDAKVICNSIATSSLVKTAMYGEDGNWGRVLAAVGYSGIHVVPNKISMWFSKGNGQNIGIGQKNDQDTCIQLLKDGQPIPLSSGDDKSAKLLSNKDIGIIVDLGLGQSTHTMWTCDLTVGYVEANSHYRT
ncbi:amino-acid N-acetyltransferase [Tieghemostelium lacteum]|uniref:Arginine biosynthesis bifunctional protein ArgJ, mitochondrial n=1 Tax=Tieghemostelium lacteum TaxID=361077 RepID=A0A152A2H2_TIELA|nr:amino-acid N-acetyltransferase [Tieghemostelium lacteum]|eukprot:KYR00453.1 amino-acid N-acetyltransferase [Tieghemostelium lacteum]